MGTIGTPFVLTEESAASVLASVGSYTLAAHDPPWAAIAPHVPEPARVLMAWEMEMSVLDERAREGCPGDVVVGLGGGTALDTAKFLAWRHDKPLIQIPTITSVDAGFTDAVGVRVDGKVRYVGKITPVKVVLDLDTIRGAPRHLNRAGIGDILSCHTGLFDWKHAVDRDKGHPWRTDLAALGEQLLADLARNTADIHAVSDDGVRFLADSYRTIGAACAEAGHSRFEEGSEHFWAYAYEHLTGAHPVHGEIIAFAVVLMSFIQENAAEEVRRLVASCGVRANPAELGISRADFDRTFDALPAYVRNENLDYSVIDDTTFDPATVDAAWEFVSGLPLVAGSS